MKLIKGAGIGLLGCRSEPANSGCFRSSACVLVDQGCRGCRNLPLHLHARVHTHARVLPQDPTAEPREPWRHGLSRGSAVGSHHAREPRGQTLNSELDPNLHVNQLDRKIAIIHLAIALTLGLLTGIPLCFIAAITVMALRAEWVLRCRDAR